MDGSACSAWWASSGRQAPRMIWGAMSTSSFVLQRRLQVDLGQHAETCFRELLAHGSHRLLVGALLVIVSV